MVVTVRWRMVSWRDWIPPTNLESCLGLILRDMILRFAWVSINVTSISATAALVFDVNLLGQWDQVYWGQSSNCAKGVCTTLEVEVEVETSAWCRSWSFWASRECKRCSSSFTNSMAPPTMDAWSPYTHKQWEENKSKVKKVEAGDEIIGPTFSCIKCTQQCIYIVLKKWTCSVYYYLW